MPFFQKDALNLYYEVHGDGDFPVLLLAPGGMRSTISTWHNQAFNPMTALAPDFKVIAMDQRNAGQSSAPVSAQDGWQTYQHDQIALLDHLGIAQCHIIGMCIGCSYAMGIIQADPNRVASAVMLQPIGHDGTNRQIFMDMFNGWMEEVAVRRPETRLEDWAAFRNSMYGGDFIFNLSEEEVSQCPVPLFILMGDDPYHPSVISRRMAEIAPNAQLLERWKDADDSQNAGRDIKAFLQQASP